jgi:hypothetical protein
MLIFAGCSGSNPLSSGSSVPAEINDYPGMLSLNQLNTGSETVLGIFNVQIDVKNLTGEIIPHRNLSAIGDVFDAHITEFLLINPCQDCLQMDGIALTPDNNIAVDFKMRHPFRDLLKRPDLHVFDVRGIILTTGILSFSDIKSDSDGDGNASEIIETNPYFLLNADGYTTHFDDATLGNFFDPPLNYDGNLNPYKNFFLDVSTGAFDPFQPKGHNVMPVNSDWDEKTFVLNSQGLGEIIFTFIVDASYGQSANRFNRDDPQYYLPEFNRKEAWQVTAEIFNDNLEEGQPISSAYLRILVKDWQAQKSRDNEYPDPNNLTGLREKSDVDQVEVTCPDFSYFEVKSKLQAEPGGNGTDANPYVFAFGPVLAGALSSGKYYCLAAVRDDLAGLGGPYAIQPIPGQNFPSKGPDITDYTAYQIFTLNVRAPGSIGCPPDPIGFYNCTYTQPFGATQNATDTVVGIGGSPSVIIDIDYGTTALEGEDRFALEQGGILGVAWDSGPGGFLPFRPGQPGFRVDSIDIDSQNRLVFSGSQLGFTTDVVTVTDRNNNATDTFYVWLLWPLPASVLATVDIDPVGTHTKKVIAIEIDQNDDVWIIDSDNYVHKYLAGENYNEDLSAGFDLDLVFPSPPAPQSFQGEIFDFVIDYFNKSLYILTDYHPNGSLYRIECNGTFYPFYGGNPNPVHGVLVGPHNGLADIIIDNFNVDHEPLDGPQDCQIIVGGGNANISGPSSFYLTRINAQLSNLRYSIRQFGAQCMAIDPINNKLRVVHGSADGNEYFSVHQEPANWY